MRDCDRALVRDTYNVNHLIRADRRMSSLVDKQLYDEVSHSAGADVTLFDIPLGASWDDYQKRAENFRSRYEEQFTQEEAMSIAWAGLSRNALAAYTACLRSNISQGILLGIDDANTREVVISIQWLNGVGGPAAVDLQWDAPKEDLAGLPKQVTAGEPIQYVVQRPKQGSVYVLVRAMIEGSPRFSDYLHIAAFGPPTPKQEPERLRFSWSDGGKLSTIDEDVPYDLAGRTARMHFIGRAHGGDLCWIAAEVSVDGRQLFATPPRYGSQNIGLDETAAIDIPYSARRMRIEFPNHGAAADWSRCEVSY